MRHRLYFCLLTNINCFLDSTWTDDSPKGLKIVRNRWSQQEEDIAFKTFIGYMTKKSNELPGRDEIRQMINANPNTFKGRNPDSIKSWLTQNRNPNHKLN